MSTTYKGEVEVWQCGYGYDINGRLTDNEGNVHARAHQITLEGCLCVLLAGLVWRSRGKG